MLDAMLLKTGLDLAKTLKDLGTQRPELKEIHNQVRAALRTFYFTPKGIIAFLKKIEAGEQVSEEELKKALIEFNDREPTIERAANLLEFERLFRENDLSLRTIGSLALLRDLKITLRRNIQEEVNYYGAGLRRTKPNVERVKQLIADIETLNASILDAEEAVGMSGRK